MICNCMYELKKYVATVHTDTYSWQGQFRRLTALIKCSTVLLENVDLFTVDAKHIERQDIKLNGHVPIQAGSWLSTPLHTAVVDKDVCNQGTCSSDTPLTTYASSCQNNSYIQPTRRRACSITNFVLYSNHMITRLAIIA